MPRPPEQLTQAELVERISKAMLEMDGDDLAALYNKEFGSDLTYIGDSMFEQTMDEYDEVEEPTLDGGDQTGNPGIVE